MIHFAGDTLVALISNQCLLMDIANHFVISAHVTLRNCDSEFAETIVVPPMRVEKNHSTIQLTSADFPIPRPDAVAIRRTDGSTAPAFFFT